MPINFEPSTPVEAYKAIIDQLVEEVTPGVSERLMREEAIYSKALAETAANRFVQSLTAEQRMLWPTCFTKSEKSAIGGVLSRLTWWLCCRKVGLTFQGQPMPFELSGEGLHGDYIGRCEGWKWPER